MPREIEVRIKLADEQKPLLTKWLEANTQLEGVTHQVEYYLDNPKSTFLFQNINGYKDSAHYLRVRFDEKKGESVCFKIFKIDQEKQTSENLDEMEFTVSSGKSALKLLESLGYTDHLIIDKTRTKYTTNDKAFEVCIDEVKNVGTFVEVELLEQIDGEIKLGRAKIYDLLRTIGLTEIDEQHRGYVSMLWNPDINFGKLKKL